MPATAKPLSLINTEGESDSTLPSTGIFRNEWSEGTASTTRRSLHLVQKLDETPSQENESELSAKDLYPDWETLSPVFSTALRLMGEAREYIDRSLDFYDNHELISADDEIQKLQVLLPELFCCRSMGDGFGQVINATLNALDNTNGVPLNKDQVVALKRVFYNLHREPFISFDKAIDQTEILEDADLLIQPSSFNKLADFLVNLTDE
jgi:hypothetical protein